MSHKLIIITLRVVTLAAWAFAAFDLIPWGWDVADNISVFVLTGGAIGAIAWISQAHMAALLNQIARPFDEVYEAGRLVERHRAELERDALRATGRRLRSVNAED